MVALQADLIDGGAVSREVAQIAPDAVVHLAAISFVGHADNSAFYAVNVVGTTNLLKALAALSKRPSRVLLASSANVYGNSKASPIAETQVPAPINHYGMSKLAMEMMAMTYADQLNLVITRPFNYTGPGQSTNFIIPKLVAHFAQKASSVSLGNLAVEREFNDVQMVCDAYMELLKHGRAGETYNVCSGQPHTLQHIIDTLTCITGHQLEVVVDPKLVRANELPRLCGNPAKLQALLATNKYVLNIPPLEKTLRHMLHPAARAN